MDADDVAIGMRGAIARDRRELIGKTDHEVFPREQADRFVARDRRVLTTGRAETIQRVSEPMIEAGQS